MKPHLNFAVKQDALLCQMTIAIMSANLYFEFQTFCLLTKIIHWVLVLIATFLKQNYFRGMDCNLQWYILPRTRPFATVTHLILSNVKVFNNSLDFINAECFVRQDCTLCIRQLEKNINIDVQTYFLLFQFLEHLNKTMKTELEINFTAKMEFHFEYEQLQLVCLTSFESFIT